MPGHAPTSSLPRLPSGAVRAARLLLRLHPAARALMTLHDLYSLYSAIPGPSNPVTTACGGAEQAVGPGAHPETCPTYVTGPDHDASNWHNWLGDPVGQSSVTTYHYIGQNQFFPSRAEYRPAHSYSTPGGYPGPKVLDPVHKPVYLPVADPWPAEHPTPEHRPLPHPARVLPRYAPQWLPPGYPQPDPPWRVPWVLIPTLPGNSPDQVPGERREVGPSPSPRPAPGAPGPSPAPVGDPDPTAPTPAPGTPHPVEVLEPLLDPAPVEPRLVTGPGVSIELRPPGRVPRVPTPRHTKERKFIAAIPPGTLGKLLGQVTESVDMIVCFHRALPKHLQAKRLWHSQANKGQGGTHRPSIRRQAAAVYRHFNGPHMQADAISRCAEQAAMDVVVAALGRANALSARRARRSSGVMLGGDARGNVTL